MHDTETDGIQGYSDTQGRVCLVPVLSRDGHNYYGVLGYSDTQSRVCAGPSIIPRWTWLHIRVYWDKGENPRMAIVTLASRVNCGLFMARLDMCDEKTARNPSVIISVNMATA